MAACVKTEWQTVQLVSLYAHGLLSKWKHKINFAKTCDNVNCLILYYMKIESVFWLLKT